MSKESFVGLALIIFEPEIIADIVKASSSSLGWLQKRSRGHISQELIFGTQSVVESLFRCLNSLELSFPVVA